MLVVVSKQGDKQKKQANLGLGLGLRNLHFEHILKHWPPIDWFEAITENFMDSGGWSINVLHQIAERYPLVLHGVSMSIGSTDPLDLNYLSKLKKLANEIKPKWISDHLCWTGVHDMNSHDLLPLPLTRESLQHVVQRVLKVQDFLQRPLVLENPSTYITFKQSTLSEPEFLSQLCQQTDCQLLLDVNNVYVSCFNADSDPYDYLNNFPCERVIQMHLAGHQHCKTHIIDTHDRKVIPQVWELFRHAWQLTGGVSTLLEWDGNIPSFDECHAEILKAKNFMHDTNQGENIEEEMPKMMEPEAISTPVDFILPPVMEKTHMNNP